MDGVLLLIILLAIYLFPGICAITSNKKNASAILILNILLGWTVIGWVIALVWAAMRD